MIDARALNPRSRATSAVGVTFAWLVVVGLTGCGRKPAPVALPTEVASTATYELVGLADAYPSAERATAGYVDDFRCAECHQEIVDEYQTVGMARSFYRPSKQKEIEDFQNNHYYHAASDRHYEMIERDGAYYQVRYQLDDEGNRINELEVKVDAIMGSGSHVRTYLYRTPNNELYQMPLAWYTDTQRWRMNPGYDVPDHQGFTRQVSRNCMFCHNAYPDVPTGSDDYWQPHLFPEALPEGIGCQRCHGPGENHIDIANRFDATLEELRDSVVNPARLEPARRDDVCNQCHLQPSSRFMSQVLRSGRPEYSYRTGEPLEDYQLHIDFENPGGGDRFEINHHPYRLRQSTCFTASDGALNCLTCHDPHHKPDTSTRHAQYRDACLSCHEVEVCDTAMQIDTAAHAAGTSDFADCVTCHMPLRRTEDVIQAAMTDHRIVKTPAPEEERMAPLPESPRIQWQGDARPYFPEHDAAAPEHAFPLARASANAGQLPQEVRLRKLIADSGTVDLAPLTELAVLQMGQQRFPEAINTLTTLLATYPDHGRAHVEIGLALDATGDPTAAIEHFQRAIELNTPMPELYLGLGGAYYHLQQYEEAVAAFRHAVAMRPIYPEALMNLGLAQQVLEDWSGSVRSITDALAAEPASSLAHWRLGLAHLHLADPQAAIAPFKQGVNMAPSDPRFCEGLALALQLSGRSEDALNEAQRGYSLQADEATLLLVAALAQYQLGNQRVAIQALQAAREALKTQLPPSYVRDVARNEATRVFGKM